VAVSNPNLPLENICGPTGDPNRVLGGEPLVVQLLLTSNDHIVRLRHDPKHITCASTTAEPEPSSLPTGEIGDPIVAPEDVSFRVDDTAGLVRVPLTTDEIPNATVRHEAELLRIGFVGVGYPESATDFANGGFRQVAERKDESLEGRLG
jgi:hypothetical protein